MTQIPSLRGAAPVPGLAALALLLVALPAEGSPTGDPLPDSGLRADSVAEWAADAQERSRTAQPRSGSSSATGSQSTVQSNRRSPDRAQPRSAQTGRESGTRHPGADRDRGRRHRSFRGGHHATIAWGYPYWPYGIWGWGWPWYPWGYYGHYGPYSPVEYYPARLRPSMGALDLDLRPEEAAVFLNGQPIGIADNFDGWPRFLWLEEGTYDLVFYHEGFETIARQYTIYPGVVVDVEDRMVRGEATPPEELIAQAAARREAQREEARNGEDGERRAGTDWRDRVRRERGRVPADADRPPADGEGARGLYDARAEPVRLILDVVPRDAAVYVDGRFLGSAEELSGDDAGVVLDPGEHEVEIVRPGYATRKETVRAEAGEEIELAIELSEAD